MGRNSPSRYTSVARHDREVESACGRKGKRSVAIMYIWLVLVPILIWIALAAIRPSFVADHINGVSVISQQKLLLWTLVFSVMGWILVYSIFYCKN